MEKGKTTNVGLISGIAINPGIMEAARQEKVSRDEENIEILETFGAIL